MGVTSQVTITSTHTRLSFESSLVAARDFASTRLDAIVWAPDEKSEVNVALTNTQSSSITNVAISSDQEQKILSLGPRETRVVDLKNFLAKVKKSLRAALVSLEHDGAPGTLIATGFVVNRKSGFSSNLTFVDCGTVKSMKLAAAHVLLGPAKPDEGFPSGTEFRAPLLIANTMHMPTDVQISVDYTLGDQAKRVQLNSITLAPLEVKQIELSREMARKGVTGPLDEAGVDISYDGMPGTVIGRLTSYDTGGDYSFDAPVKDPLAGANRSNGSYPWRLDNGYSTVLHLKNTTEKEVEAAVQVRYDGGSYNPELVKLAPYQTVAVDIRLLKDDQQEDIRGAVMPKEVESGQVAWYETESGTLIGRAEVVNIEAGISSTFSCPGGCPCGLVWYSGSMNPSSGSAFVGDSGFMFAPSEMRKDCNNILYGPYSVTANEWFTSNASVVTVTNSGIETCVAPGSATITGKWPTVVAYNTYSCGCCPINGYGTAPATCDVLRTPHHLKLGNDLFGTTGCGGVLRELDYIVVDSSGTNPVGNISIIEDPDGAKTDSCSGQQVAFTTSCSPKVNSVGIFLDILQTGCPSSGGSCGFDVPNNKWEWCHGTTQVTLATLNYSVHFDQVKVNGRATAWPENTQFFP